MSSKWTSSFEITLWPFWSDDSDIIDYMITDYLKDTVCDPFHGRLNYTVFRAFTIIVPTLKHQVSHQPILNEKLHTVTCECVTLKYRTRKIENYGSIPEICAGVTDAFVFIAFIHLFHERASHRDHNQIIHHFVPHENLPIHSSVMYTCVLSKCLFIIISNDYNLWQSL